MYMFLRVHPRQAQQKSGLIWITRAGKCYLCNNNSRIPAKTLSNIMAIIEARSSEVIGKWQAFFGEARYFC